MWAGIKHALNSTLGTKDFQPLDKLYYKGKSLVASDNLYMYIINSRITVDRDSSYTVPEKLVMKNAGSIKLRAEMSYYSTPRLKVNIYVNSSLRLELTRTDEATNTTDVVSGQLKYNAGDVVTFKIVNTYTASGSISQLTLHADVIDTSMLDIEVVE